MSKIKNALAIASILILISCLNCCSTANSNQLSVSDGQKLHASILPGKISPPIGYFLLIRKDNNTCAIRFTNYSNPESGRLLDSDASTNNDTAEYDYFNQYDGSGNFMKNNLDSGHAKLNRLVIVSRGVARISGLYIIKCGSLTLRWNGNSEIDMFQGKFISDEGIKFAPTKWRDISEINVDDPNIEWFGVDKKRRFTSIPVENL